jgi:hypothetical protein
MQNTKKPIISDRLFKTTTYSHITAVPSAQAVTTLFGMGRGGRPRLLSYKRNIFNNYL